MRLTEAATEEGVTAAWVRQDRTKRPIDVVREQLPSRVLNLQPIIKYDIVIS